MITKKLHSKNIIKSEIIVILLENIEVLLCSCKLRYETLKEIPAVFHNGAKYDYHFIIKELTKESDRRKNRKVFNIFSTN